VHLENKDGGVIAPDALPTSLEQLPDGPYRSLAWMVRKKDGFCRALMQQKEFADAVKQFASLPQRSGKRRRGLTLLRSGRHLLAPLALEHLQDSSPPHRM
jgi:hypothetical protein